MSITGSSNNREITFDNLIKKTVLVVGGSGRVGGSVVTQLIKRGSNVVVGGTRQESFDISQQRWIQMFPEFKNEINSIQFYTLNKENANTITSAIKSTTVEVDLIINTAGPFQGKAKTPNGVLEASIENNIPYIDVCDDYCTARSFKTTFAQQAQERNIPCIISTGCWPGVSSLMAKQLLQSLTLTKKIHRPEKVKIDFSFFTAGSGGAGATLLVATFLILAEQALQIKNGRRIGVKAMQEYKTVHFGHVIGDKDIAPLNLLETASIHDTLGVGNVQSLFGTDPPFWNALLGFMVKIVPSDVLANEDLMEKLGMLY